QKKDGLIYTLYVIFYTTCNYSNKVLYDLKKNNSELLSSMLMTGIHIAHQAESENQQFLFLLFYLIFQVT
ncbi:MAG: hypothetical protein ABS939_09105, partial [Psychrobacillus sp.]